MSWSLLETAMKATTFLGVATAAYLLTMRHDSKRLYAVHLALGAVGVALIVANAAIATSPLGILVDLGYLCACLLALAEFLADARRAQAGAKERGGDARRRAGAK